MADVADVADAHATPESGGQGTSTTASVRSTGGTGAVWLWLTLIVFLLGTALVQSTSFITVYYSRGTAGTAYDVTFIQGTQAVVSLVAIVSAGWLSDRWNRKGVPIVGALLAGAGAGMFWALTARGPLTFLWAMVAYALLTAGTLAFTVGWLTLLADVSRRRAILPAVLIYAVLQIAAGRLLPLLATISTLWLALTAYTNQVGASAPLYATCAVCCVLAVLLTLPLRAPLRGSALPEATATQDENGSLPRWIVRRPAMLVALVCAFTWALILASILGVVLSRAPHDNYAFATQLYNNYTMTGIEIALLLVLIVLLRRVRWGFVLVAFLVVVAGLSAALLHAPEAYFLLAAQALMVALALGLPIVETWVLVATPRRLQGRMLALVLLANFLGAVMLGVSYVLPSSTISQWAPGVVGALLLIALVAALAFPAIRRAPSLLRTANQEDGV